MRAWVAPWVSPRATSPARWPLRLGFLENVHFPPRRPGLPVTNPLPVSLFTPPDPATLVAMLVLYLSLALVSAAVGRRRPTTGGAPQADASHGLRHQVNAWWRLFPFVSAAWLSHPWGPWLLWLLIAVFAGRELACHRAHAPRGFQLGCAALWAGQLGMLVVAWNAAEAVWVLAGLPAVCLVLAAVYVLRRRRRDDLLVLVFAVACAGVAFMVCLPRLASASGADAAAWFFFLMTVTALNDIAQFVSGKRFGKQKIARRISPNKTWQGLLGGVLASALVAWLLGRWLGLAGQGYLLVLGLAISLTGFGGDLMFSAAKRRLGLKDFSNLLPGHGGILDRVDSLVLTAPLLCLALYFVPPGRVL